MNKNSYTYHDGEWLIINNIMELKEFKKLDPIIQKLEITRNYVFDSRYSQMRANDKRKSIKYNEAFAGRYFFINIVLERLKSNLERKVEFDDVVEWLTTSQGVDIDFINENTYDVVDGEKQFRLF